MDQQQVPSVDRILDGSRHGMKMRGETFCSLEPLGAAWRYGIVLPASRRACRKHGPFLGPQAVGYVRR